MYIENDRRLGNDEEWKSDKEFDKYITQNVARKFIQHGHRITLPNLESDLKGIDMIVDDKIKIDIKGRRRLFSETNDFLIEIVKNGNKGPIEAPGWAVDASHVTDYVMYVFYEKMFLFPYSKCKEIGTFALDNWNWKCGITKSKSTIPLTKFGTTYRNNDYSTQFYFASLEELGPSLKIRDLH